MQCWCCCVQAALLYAQYLFVELIPLTFLLVRRCAISLRCRFGALSEHRTDWARLGHALVSLHNKRGLGTFDAKDSTPFKVAWCMDSQKGEEEPKKERPPIKPSPPPWVPDFGRIPCVSRKHQGLVPEQTIVAVGCNSLLVWPRF